METDMTPSEALRLSRAATLAAKHGIDADSVTGGHEEFILTIEQVAALIDEVCAPLRKQINDAIREAERDARDAYAQGEAAEAERHGPGY